MAACQEAKSVNQRKWRDTNRSGCDLCQKTRYAGDIGATWKCYEVSPTTRSAIAGPKVRNWNERIGQLRQRLTPKAFHGCIRYRVENISHFSGPTQVVDMPVPCAVAAQMPPHARPQPACSARTADVEVMAHRQAMLPQASDDNRLRTRNEERQHVGAMDRRQVMKVGHDHSAE